jgi:hypothetical protein
LRGGLGKTPLVFRRVRQLGGGPVHHLHRAALQPGGAARPAVRRLGGGGQSLFQPLPRQPLTGLHVSRVTLLDRAFAVQAEERLHLAHHLAAGGPGLEHLPDEAFQGEAQTEDALATVKAVILGGEERGGQEIAQVLLELGQGALADGAGGAPAQGGQPGAEGREAGCVHSEYIYSLS